MTLIVTEDPDVLLKPNMQQAVQYSLKDTSTMVREAAVDLIGELFILVTNICKVESYMTNFNLIFQGVSSFIKENSSQSIMQSSQTGSWTRVSV